MEAMVACDMEGGGEGWGCECSQSLFDLWPGRKESAEEALGRYFLIWTWLLFASCSTLWRGLRLDRSGWRT